MLLPTAERDSPMRSAAAVKLLASATWTNTLMSFIRSMAIRRPCPGRRRSRGPFTLFIGRLADWGISFPSEGKRADIVARGRLVYALPASAPRKRVNFSRFLMSMRDGNKIMSGAECVAPVAPGKSAREGWSLLQTKRHPHRIRHRAQRNRRQPAAGEAAVDRHLRH